MRKFLLTTLGVFSTLLLEIQAFAADVAAPIAQLGGNTALAAAIGMGIAACGCGIAQGMSLKSACEGTARNPEASGKIMITLILGLAFIESIAIYAFVVNLLLLVANPFLG
ncbi:MAG: ATP synthase F0 subunit C [Desulfovibrionaceae bacterium]